MGRTQTDWLSEYHQGLLGELKSVACGSVAQMRVDKDNTPLPRPYPSQYAVFEVSDPKPPPW